MHRPAMAEPRLLQDAAHPRRVCAHQVHDARLLIRHLPHAVQAVQPGGRQQPDMGQIDDHRPIGPRGLRHCRGQRRATVGIDLAVDSDDRDRVPAPALHPDLDRRVEDHRNSRYRGGFAAPPGRGEGGAGWGRPLPVHRVRAGPPAGAGGEPGAVASVGRPRALRAAVGGAPRVGSGSYGSADARVDDAGMAGPHPTRSAVETSVPGSGAAVRRSHAVAPSRPTVAGLARLAYPFIASVPRRSGGYPVSPVGNSPGGRRDRRPGRRMLDHTSTRCGKGTSGRSSDDGRLLWTTRSLHVLGRRTATHRFPRRLSGVGRDYIGSAS